MANKDNTLAHLVADSQFADQFETVFDLQLKLQKRLGVDFSNMSISHIAEYCIYNNHCMSDEQGEFLDSLGGKDGNASWKHWKAANQEMKNKKFSDLSNVEILEAKYEVVDMFHFFINYALSIGMTGSELFNMYVAKNQENHKRQDENY